MSNTTPVPAEDDDVLEEFIALPFEDEGKEDA
jgi:hypothetical protein